MQTTKTLKLVQDAETDHDGSDFPPVKFPIGSLVVLNHNTSAFADVIGTGTVVSMPKGIIHHPAMVAVQWHIYDDGMVSAPYEPVFLEPVEPHREEIRLEVEAAAHQWQVRQMAEWLAKPIGHKVTPGDFVHRIICAVQIIREQVPAYSVSKLAVESGISRSTLRDRLNGNSVLTVTDLYRVAVAMDVSAIDIMELANKGTK
ncbi:hypothetical protein GCM10023063_38770 [Arthrobacter methylotrophus]|uniref:Helix-turn-helix domain-containing protein n=1 Tax=Arthrobacter methylotrophus TaxID=121291 RepID=A0ABV5UTT7_9MICC